MIRDAHFLSPFKMRSKPPALRLKLVTGVFTWLIIRIMVSQDRQASVIPVMFLVVSESARKFEKMYDCFDIRCHRWSWTILWTELQWCFPHNEDWWRIPIWSSASPVWLWCQASKMQQTLIIGGLFQRPVACLWPRGVSRWLWPVWSAQQSDLRPCALQPSPAHHRPERQVHRSDDQCCYQDYSER